MKIQKTLDYFKAELLGATAMFSQSQQVVKDPEDSGLRVELVVKMNVGPGGLYLTQLNNNLPYGYMARVDEIAEITQKCYIQAKSFDDVYIVNPSKPYGQKLTNICSYFYEQHDSNPNPTVNELLEAIRPHFVGSSDYSHIQINGKHYSIEKI